MDVGIVTTGNTVLGAGFAGDTTIGAVLIGNGNGKLGTANPVTTSLLFLNINAFLLHSYLLASCKL